jgi:altronate dehydratase
MFLLLSYFELTQKEFEIISKGEVKFSVCVIENKIPYLTIRFTNQTGSIICGVACLSIEQDDDFNAINILLNDSRNKNLLSMRVLGLDAKLISLLQKLIADIKDHKIAFEKATKFQLAYSDEQIEKMAQYSFKIN